MKGVINKVTENQVSDIQFSKHDEFLINKFFKIDMVDNYLRNYIDRNNVKYDKKLMNILNRSINEEELKHFKCTYQFRLDKVKQNMEQNELKMSKKNDTRVSVMDE